jgi:hypothetical protein
MLGVTGSDQRKGGATIAHYRSYLVRVWTSTGREGPQWAGRVECIQNDALQRRFNDPQALLEYLRASLLEGAADRESSGLLRAGDEAATELHPP